MIMIGLVVKVEDQDLDGLGSIFDFFVTVFFIFEVEEEIYLVRS